MVSTNKYRFKRENRSNNNTRTATYLTVKTTQYIPPNSWPEIFLLKNAMKKNCLPNVVTRNLTLSEQRQWAYTRMTKINVYSLLVNLYSAGNKSSNWDY